jgi:hypothetical protein
MGVARISIISISVPAGIGAFGRVTYAHDRTQVIPPRDSVDTGPGSSIVKKAERVLAPHARLEVGGRSHLAPADLVRVTPAGSPFMQCCWVTFGQCVSADRYSVQVRRGHSPLGRNPVNRRDLKAHAAIEDIPAANHLYSIVFCHSEGAPWQPRPSW